MTTTTISPCYRPTGVCTAHHHHTHFRVGTATHKGRRAFEQEVTSPCCSLPLYKKTVCSSPFLPLRTPLFSASSSSSSSYYVLFISSSRLHNLTKRRGKTRALKRNPLDGASRSGKWDEIGTKREIVQMTSTGSSESQVTSSSLGPVLLGSLALPVSSSLCPALRSREFLALGSFLLVITSG